MAADTYPDLYKPGKIAALTLNNRLVTAPMTRVSAGPDGLATRDMATYYANFAKGGFGLIISEGTYPSGIGAQGYVNQPGLTNDAQVEAWSMVTKAVHDAGGVIFSQLMHAGAMSQYSPPGWQNVAPSAVQPVGEMANNYIGVGPFPMPRELSLEDIEQIIDGFGLAAKNAVDAGFDGVEVHGANGYLPAQFACPEANVREDEYGGSLENRMRFHTRVMTRVLAAVAGAVPAGIRISQVKVNDRGYVWPDGLEHAKAIFSAMAKAGADYVHLNAPPAPVEVFDTGKSLLGLAKLYFGGPVIGCGGLNDPELAQGLLASGDVDFIAMARAALADPRWPDKIAGGDSPVEFDMGMTTPMAHLENTKAFRAKQA